jgi:hypothetical protein
MGPPCTFVEVVKQFAEKNSLALAARRAQQAGAGDMEHLGVLHNAVQRHAAEQEKVLSIPPSTCVCSLFLCPGFPRTFSLPTFSARRRCRCTHPLLMAKRGINSFAADTVGYSFFVLSCGHLQKQTNWFAAACRNERGAYVQRQEADELRSAAEEGMSARQIAARVQAEVQERHATFQLQSLFHHSSGPLITDAPVRPPPFPSQHRMIPCTF